MRLKTRNDKPYTIRGLGKTIIAPKHRYIPSRGTQGRMYHSDIRIVNGKNTTMGCDHVDSSGFCLGHEMTRKEFINNFCGGVIPEEWIPH